MKTFQKRVKKLDISLLFLLPVFATGFSLFLHANTLTSILVFYFPLAVYLSVRTKHAVLKTVVFSLFLTVLFGLVFDYMAYLDQAWYVPSVFPYRIYGKIAGEDIIWSFFFVYTVVIFYEHFIDKAKHKVLEGKAKYGILLSVILILLFFTILTFIPQILHLSYYYFWLGCLLLFLPVLAMLSYYHRLISGFFITAAYFFAHSLIYELTALQLGQWFFPGTHYIGWVALSGIKFPVEELFFFMMIGAMAVLTYFEFFGVKKI